MEILITSPLASTSFSRHLHSLFHLFYLHFSLLSSQVLRLFSPLPFLPSRLEKHFYPLPKEGQYGIKANYVGLINDVGLILQMLNTSYLVLKLAYFYDRPPTELREGNVFSLCVCHSAVRMGSPWNHYS